MFFAIIKKELFRQDVQIQKKGKIMSSSPRKSLTNWEKVYAMTDEEIASAVASDPDTFFLTDEEMKQMKRVHPVEKIDVKEVRSLLQMTQEQFAHYFGVNPRTIQEWEQKRRKPSSMARNFLKVIAYNPKIVREALAG